MTAPLRINEALLIANHAFKPFQCVAWAPQDGNGELSLTVIDRTNSHIGRKQIPSSAYSDPAQLEQLLQQKGILEQPLAWAVQVRLEVRDGAAARSRRGHGAGAIPQ